VSPLVDALRAALDAANAYDSLRMNLRALVVAWLNEAKDADAHTQCDLEQCAEQLLNVLDVKR